jgi:peptidoglycan/LPS O-acetylase OafA/YrhL
MSAGNFTVLPLAENSVLQASSDQSTNARYLPDIDGLRAIAVLLVVGFHAFPSVVTGGLVGVDVFFVISGFLITTIIIGDLCGGKFRLLIFYQRRVRRIFPALLVVLVSCFAAGWFVMLPDAFANFAKQVTATTAFSSNLLLWNESSYFDAAERANPLLHMWSLGVEEQFYLVWPLIVSLVWTRRRGLLPVVLAIAIISFGLNVIIIQTHPVADFYSPFTRAWELLTGSLLACARAKESSLGSWISDFQRYVASALGAALLIIAPFVVSQNTPFPGWWALLPVSGTVLVIACGGRTWLNRKILANPMLVLIGLISYPIYLWHWPLLTFANYIASNDTSILIRLAMIALSILLAAGTYQFVECPLRFGRGLRQKSVMLLAAMSILGAFGLTAYLQGGFPSRFPGMVQKLTDFTYASEDLYRYGSCFLRPEQDFREFAKCVDPDRTPNNKLLFLWGDSHAAHLYPGYQLIADNLNIIQRNASACPPLLGFRSGIRPFCKSINDYDFALIERIHPDEVVLSAAWTQYDWSPYLEPTVIQLRKAGVRHITVVGPAPMWTDQLAKLLYASFRANPLHVIPSRLPMIFKPDVFDIDHALGTLAKQLGVEYISLLSILCDKDGCLTKLADNALMQWDDSHFTAEGSRYLVARFPAAARPSDQ